MSVILPFSREAGIANKLEAWINNERVPYDACGTKDLDECINYYKNYNYIGSGYTYFFNNRLNDSDTLIHFFVKKQ